MNEQELQELEALCKAATPGPWTWSADNGCLFAPRGVCVAVVDTCPQQLRTNENDRVLIAAVPIAIPKLIAEVRRLRAEIAAYRRGHGAARRDLRVAAGEWPRLRLLGGVGREWTVETQMRKMQEAIRAKKAPL